MTLAQVASAQAPATDAGAPTKDPQPPPVAAPAVAPKVKGEVSLKQSFGAMVDGKLQTIGPNDKGPLKASVGTPLIIQLDIKRPLDTSLALPQEQKTGRFELLDVERVPVQVQPGDTSVTETVKMSFAVYRPGTHVLEPFDLKIMDAEGGISAVSTQAVKIRIVSVVANEKDPQMPAVRKPVSVWIEDWTLTWIAGIALGLLLAFGLGALLYKVLTPPPPPPPPPPPRPAHEIALEKLGAIAASSLLDEGQSEEFYVRVSEAVREYLGRRYNLSLTDPAGLEMTTEELTALLLDVRWPRGMDLHFVTLLLQDCDIVKFARYAPTEDEATDVLRRAFQLVELTRATILGEGVLGSKTEEDAKKDTAEEVDAPAEPAQDGQEPPAQEESSPYAPSETAPQAEEDAEVADDGSDDGVSEAKEGDEAAKVAAEASEEAFGAFEVSEEASEASDEGEDKDA